MGKHEMETAATQVAHPWRATVRTAFAVVVSLCALAPVVYEAAAQGDASTATGAMAGVLGVAAAVTRVLARPEVDAFLKAYLPWLASEPKG